MSKLRETKKKKNYFGLIYGRPGTGKTTLLSGLNRPFFIGNEINREFDFQGFEPCKTWNDFISQLKDVENYSDKFDVLVVDNFSDIEGLMKADFIEEGKNLSTCLGSFGAGYNECEKRTRELIDIFQRIQEKEKSIVLLCHAKEKTIEDRLTGASHASYMPDLEAKTLKPIEAYADFVFHLHRPLTTNITDKAAELNRFLFTTFTAGGHAKKKSFIDVPDEILWKKEDWSMMQRLHDKIVGGLGSVDTTKDMVTKEDKEVKELYKRAVGVTKLPDLKIILEKKGLNETKSGLQRIIEGGL